MASAAVATHVAVPAARRLVRPVLIAGAGLALLGVVVVGGLAAGRLAGASPLALADIPADYVAAYQAAGEQYSVDWAILAAIGKIECDHGRSQAAGCNPPGTVNTAGATGPMQFIGSTWRAGTPPMTVPAVGPPARAVSEGYAADGDGDGLADVWNPADAIAGAARLLRTNGAPADYKRALFAYNHADWYVREVIEIAADYRDAGTSSPVVAIGSASASVAAVLTNPRITLTGVQRVDLASGLIDPRVVALLAWLGRSHALVVTALRSDHSLYTTEGNVSNHSFGRAVDIGAVDGEACTGAPSGACGRLAVAIAGIAGPLHSTELIYCFDPDGPLSSDAFARADHCDHIHVGYEE
jgi:hypothetical protein